MEVVEVLKVLEVMEVLKVLEEVEALEVVEVVSILQPGSDSSVRLGPSGREESSGLSEDRVSAGSAGRNKLFLVNQVKSSRNNSRGRPAGCSENKNL